MTCKTSATRYATRLSLPLPHPKQRKRGATSVAQTTPPTAASHLSGKPLAKLTASHLPANRRFSPDGENGGSSPARRHAVGRQLGLAIG